MNDYMIFGFILLAAIVGWFVGHRNGHMLGYTMANLDGLLDYPIINVSMEHLEGDVYLFYYILTGDFIMKGTVKECNAHILSVLEKEDPEAEVRIIYSMRVPEDEQPV